MDTYIFDFDGTLANSGETGILATQAAFEEFNLPWPDRETIIYYMGIPIEVSFKKMALPHTFDGTEFEDLLSCFRAYYKRFETSHLHLFPGTQEVLQQLKKAQKHLYVVSSKHSSSLARNLEQLDIAQYFDGIIGSDDVHHYKPAPDGILFILERFQRNEKTTLMIGDAVFDLQMGQAAHVKTCGVTWGAHSKTELQQAHPDFLISDMRELLKIK